MRQDPVEKEPLFPGDSGNRRTAPFGELFGNTVLAHIIEVMTEEPSRKFSPKTIRDRTGASMPRIRDSLKKLVSIGLIENRSGSVKRPVFVLRQGQKRVAALTFLMHAVTDDRNGTDAMDHAVMNTYRLGNQGRSVSPVGITGYRIIASRAILPGPGMRQQYAKEA
ncbi:MAG: hypothetical protein LUQ25_05455 [Methanoregulaceae archaeon]|nr:hypothetical protein [Methanoregulaceae archaeon]